MRANVKEGEILGDKLLREEGTDRMASDSAAQSAIIVTTLSDISEIKTSDPVGQMASEEIMSGLERKGFRVVDAKVANGVVFNNSENGGEFILSRELRQVARQFNTKFVVVGTYTKGPENYIVALRVIRLPEQEVVTSSNYTLPRLESNSWTDNKGF